MLSDPWFYAAAIPAVVVVGLSKGGFGGGLSLLGAPLLTLVMPPLDAAAIMLPILCLMDVVAVMAWWGIYDRRSVAVLVPGTTLGIVVGWAMAAHVSDAAVELIVGATALAFVLNYWLRGGAAGEGAPHSWAKGTIWGAVGGFTSFVAHAGGPPVQVYMLPLKLDPKVFAGTSVLVFAIANAIKLVPYAALGQFTTPHLMASAVLLPVAPVATWAGARLVHIVPVAIFYRITYAILFLVALKLLYDGITGVF